MYLHEIVELAAVTATHSAALVCGPGEVTESSLERYWTTSKCRLDRWGHALRHVNDLPSAALRTEQGEQLLTEIFTTEVLTRVWTAILSGRDRRRGGPIARSVYIGHLEARNRAQSLLLGGRIALETAAKLDALRRRCERWTDFMLAQLLLHIDITEFAHDPGRARDFADDLQYDAVLSYGSTGWQLQMASLRAAFRSAGGQGPNTDLNSRIAASVTCCFPPELFDGCGVLQSVWYNRLSHHCDDAQGLIDQLFQAEHTPASPNIPGFIHRDRYPSTQHDNDSWKDSNPDSRLD